MILRSCIAILFVIACAAKKTASPAAVIATAAWHDRADITFDLATTSTSLQLDIAHCTKPVLHLHSASGGEVKELTLLASDAGLVTLPRAGLFPEAPLCSLAMHAVLSAEVSCSEGAAPITETLNAIFSPTVTAIAAPAFAPQFARRLSTAAQDPRLWLVTSEGVSVVSAAAGASASIAIAGVKDSGVHLRVTGGLHTFFTAGCAGHCADLSTIDSDGLVVSSTPEWIVAIDNSAIDNSAIDNTATGTLDAYARIAVPGRVVDLTFVTDTLYVLSQANDRVILSAFLDSAGLPTSDELAAKRTVLPFAQALRFSPGVAEAPLIVGLSTADASAVPVVLPTPPNAVFDQIPVPYPSSGGGCGGGCCIAPGAGPSGGFGQSVGDSPGVCGPHTSGCIKFMLFGAFGPVRDTSSLEAQLTYGDSAVHFTRPSANVTLDVVASLVMLDRAVLAFDAGNGQSALLLYDSTAGTATWLSFPGVAAVAVAALTPSTDGAHFAVTTTTGFHIFDSAGTWQQGIDPLPESCLSAQAPLVTFTSATQYMAQLRSGPVALPLP